MHEIPSLEDIVNNWIKANFPTIRASNGEIAIPGINKAMRGEYGVICGRIGPDWVRVRGRYFYAYKPDFFETLKAELQACLHNPERGWPESHSIPITRVLWSSK